MDQGLSGLVRGSRLYTEVSAVSGSTDFKVREKNLTSSTVVGQNSSLQLPLWKIMCTLFSLVDQQRP